MGIVKSNLAEFMADGMEFRVELNESGEVHIHIDALRIDMSKSEYNTFRSHVIQANEQLNTIKQSNETE